MSLTLEIITPDERVLSTEADQVVLPNAEQLTFLL